MGNSGLKQHIENSKKTGVFQLKDANLSEFPPEIFELASNLRTLDLSGNKLCELPSRIGCLGALKHLALSRNRLGTIPEEVGQIIKLDTLLLNSNKMTSLPRSLSNLKHLKMVNLSDNQLTRFPMEFCDLKHLDVLDLSKNKIGEVPSGAGRLQVVELNLNQNQVSLISDDLAKCPRLKTLRLEENCLALAAISPALLKDSSVSLLTVEGNLFDIKDLLATEGYSEYMERYTATKKKMY